MKYIDADRLRAEIERLKAENNCGTDEFIAAKDIAYDKVLSFLSTLEPVTDCHELEEAAREAWSVYEYRDHPQGLYASCYEDGFKAGAEWQKAKMLKDAEIVAQMFGSPCDYDLDLDVLNKICDCENECGSEKTPARCWQKYFDYKREKED